MTIKKAQAQQPVLDTPKLIQNDQSLDARITALEKAVNLLMRNYQQFEDTGALVKNDD